MRRFLSAAVLIAFAGCKPHDATPSAVDQMVAAIQPGMTQEQIVGSYSQPKGKRNDPTSGLEIWSYEPEPGKGGVLVYFNDEKVSTVRKFGL